MTNKKGQLIVALDVDSFDEARSLIDQLKDDVDIFKVGSQLFTANGPEIIRYLLKSGKKVFLDLKFHDIPNTVANAVRAAVNIREGSQSIFMCTLHTVGGEEMLHGAVEAAKDAAQSIGVARPYLLGITVLTSEDKTDNIQNLVLKRAQLAKSCGLDGVVASSQEVAFLRQEMGKDLMIVTPGIRPKGADTGDQRRVATPKDAIEAGSDFLVVGRPIVATGNPSESAKNILKEIEGSGNLPDSSS